MILIYKTICHHGPKIQQNVDYVNFAECKAKANRLICISLGMKHLASFEISKC